MNSVDELILEGNQSNPKPVFIVLATDEKVHLSFLDKILIAIGLDRTTDVVAVFTTDKNAAIHRKVSSYDNAKVLIFGVPSKKLGLNFSYKEYEPVLFDGVEYLFSDNLEKLQSDKRKKLALWNTLQIIFPKK